MPEPRHEGQTRRVYTGRIINLDVDRVRLPNGTEAEFEIIRHPGASAIVPVLDDLAAVDPTIVLVRQFRYAAGGYLYEIPAGLVNDGEIPADCAARELTEETGYRAARMELLFSMFTTPGFTDERIHVYRASELTPGAPAREPDEVMSTEEMPLSRALALIETGKIQDAKTALGILFFSKFGRWTAKN